MGIFGGNKKEEESVQEDEVFKCKKCKAEYDTQEEADECCKPTFTCKNCEAEYDTQKEADECCKPSSFNLVLTMDDADPEDITYSYDTKPEAIAVFQKIALALKNKESFFEFDDFELINIENIKSMEIEDQYGE